MTKKKARKGLGSRSRSSEETRENGSDFRSILTTSAGCHEDFTAVWVTFENSLDSRQRSVDTEYVENKEECQEKCNRQVALSSNLKKSVFQNCRSFSFFDKESQCQLNIDSDGVHLKKSHNEDFSSSTSTRFCYASNFFFFFPTAFKNLFLFSTDATTSLDSGICRCRLNRGNSSTAFRKDTLDCSTVLNYAYWPANTSVEWVLSRSSSKRTLQSASFLVSEGTCLLNSEDSLTKPDLFKPTLSEDHLYFENACSSPPPLKDHGKRYQSRLLPLSDKENVSIERVSYPKASPLKKLQQKTYKPT